MQLLTLTALLVAATISTANGNFSNLEPYPIDSEGVVYTRWGKTSCPSEALRVYEGIMGGSHYKNEGGGANYLCMSKSVEFISNKEPKHYSKLYPTEYQTDGRIFSDMHNRNAPCVVCYKLYKTAKMMIPGKTSCPSSWTREYHGYLMAGNYYRYFYECIDASPESLPKTEKNKNGALLHFTVATCNLPCPPYEEKRAITCVVCTK